MNVLIVVESSFGNTARIAEAVAAGLRSRGATVRVEDAAGAPAVAGHDLVVVGAPTHNLGLPNAKSREQATEKGGHAPTAGVQEWLGALARTDVRAAAFDTAVAGRFSGSAAKRIDKLLRTKGAKVAARESFVVAGDPPALADGELARAEAWGAGLA